MVLSKIQISISIPRNPEELSDTNLNAFYIHCRYRCIVAIKFALWAENVTFPILLEILHFLQR